MEKSNDTQSSNVDVQTVENAQQDTQPVNGNERVLTPRASVFETSEEVILEVEMPGVPRDNISVNVHSDELSISGKRLIPVDDGYEVLHQERLPLNYRRTFIISDRIDSANIKASTDNGVLRLLLPKAAKAQPRKITIE